MRLALMGSGEIYGALMPLRSPRVVTVSPLTRHFGPEYGSQFNPDRKTTISRVAGIECAVAVPGIRPGEVDQGSELYEADGDARANAPFRA